MMIKYFDFPAFFLTLLPETALLNIKYSSKSYWGIPLQHVHGKCSDGVGHPYIHLVDDAVRRVGFFRQIEWSKLEFEEDKVNNRPAADPNNSPYISFK
jgi:hypothetical protein